MARHQNWRHDGGLHPLVVVGIDAHLHLLRVEGELADLQRLELVVGLQVRPAPHAAIDHVRQALPVRHLRRYKRHVRYRKCCGELLLFNRKSGHDTVPKRNRVGKTRVFLKKTQPSGFFCFFLVFFGIFGFFGFFGFFWVFLGFLPRREGF
jgi:hypothetical protein